MRTAIVTGAAGGLGGAVAQRLAADTNRPLAARLGLSRTEYLRRRLRQEAARPVGPVTAADLERFSERFADLGDAGVMRRAWSGGKPRAG